MTKTKRTPRAVGTLAREMSARLGRTVYVVRDDEGPLLAWCSGEKANGTKLIGAPEDVREDREGYYLESTGERIV